MDELVKEGKVRHIIAQSNTLRGLAGRRRCSRIAEKTQLPAASVVSQPMYNLLARGIEQEFLPMSKEFGIANVVYNPLAGGLHSPRQDYNAAEPIQGDSRFDKNKMYLDRYWHTDEFLRPSMRSASIAQKIGSLHGEPRPVLAASPHVDRLRHPRRFRSSNNWIKTLAAAEEGPLDAETLAAIDKGLGTPARRDAEV